MPSSFRPTRRSARVLVGIAALAVLGSGAAAYAAIGDTNGAARHTSGDQTADIAAQIKYGKAKNVILFIGDGMGDSEITVARDYLVGAGGTLPGLDSLPLTGQYTTYALHKDGSYAGKPDYVTDSAASGSGWATGTKTYNGAISVGLDGMTAHQTLLEWAKSQGLKTGDVTTAEIQDATPAVQYAHVADRGCYAPTGTKGMTNCPDQVLDDAHPNGIGSISEQLLSAKPDVTLGGGKKYFSEVIQGGVDKGKTVRAAAEDKGFAIVEDATALAAVAKADQTQPLLGLFAAGNMNTRFKATPAKHLADLGTGAGSIGNPDTCVPNDSPAWPGTQPSLKEMTTKAIDLLDNDKGFFLQVEGASIDKQDHAANPCGQIGETLDLDEAVASAQKWVKDNHHENDTLIIVTADHGHTSQIINPEDVGTGASVPPGLVYTLKTTDGAPMMLSYGTADFGGSQQHTGTQVRVAGSGPGAANVVGLSDQTDIFATIKRALSGTGLDPAPAPQTVPGATVTVTAAPSAAPTSTVTVTAPAQPAPTVTVTAKPGNADNTASIQHKISALKKQIRHAKGARKAKLQGQLAAYQAIQRQLD